MIDGPVWESNSLPTPTGRLSYAYRTQTLDNQSPNHKSNMITHSSYQLLLARVVLVLVFQEGGMIQWHLFNIVVDGRIGGHEINDNNRV